MERMEKSGSYSAMLPSLNQACFGSYLILPFRFQEGGFRSEWADRTFIPRDVTTVDLDETTRSKLSRNGHVSIGSCWLIPRDVLFHEMSGIDPNETQTLCVETENGARTFSLTDSWLYVFRSRVAFLALGICFDDIRTLADIVNPGGVDSRASFSCNVTSGRMTFSLSDWVDTIASRAGLQGMSGNGSNPFIDAFPYTLAVVPEPFPDLDGMRQASFNLHLMIPFSNPITDNSEDDVRFVYAKINEISHTYRWAACISSQSVAYLSADPDMDLSGQMLIRGRAGLPVVMLALYEKHTCLRYTDAIADTDIRHLKPIRRLRMEMLEFKAYGTVAPANISRWSNIRQIYRALLETNEIPAAIADVDYKISILDAYQREIVSGKTKLMTNLITAFGVVSILASVLSIIQILIGAKPILWISMALTAAVLFLAFLLTLFHGKNQ